jgi:hypothetical protein
MALVHWLGRKQYFMSGPLYGGLRLSALSVLATQSSSTLKGKEKHQRRFAPEKWLLDCASLIQACLLAHQWQGKLSESITKITPPVMMGIKKKTCAFSKMKNKRSEINNATITLVKTILKERFFPSLTVFGSASSLEIKSTLCLSI